MTNKKITEAEEIKTAEKTVSETSEQKTEIAVECKKFIYVGPNISGSLLHKNMIFSGTKAEIMKIITKEQEKYPFISNLFIPLENLAEARIQTETEGSALYEFCRRITENN